MSWILTQESSWSLSLILCGIVAWAIFQIFKVEKRPPGSPPVVSHLVPFVGNLLEFGLNPLQFLKENYEKYGDSFSFVMFGRRMTFLLGAEGNNFVLNTCKLKEVSAEEAYKHLTTPVFGEGVVYDVPNHVLMDQKKFVKHGLSTENLRIYVEMIEKETREYFKRWSSGKGVGDLATSIAELTIITASTCLMGKEIRQHLDSGRVAQLYYDLDKGFTPINFLFPWLPLPQFKRRDRAHIQMRELFLSIMKERRQNNDAENFDMIQALMDSEYRDGRKMTDREVACLMIALLMAGQHTSSTTGTWCLSYLAENPEIRKALLAEQRQVLGDNYERPLDYDALKNMPLLDNCIRETLRLKPPIIVLMRKVMEDVRYKDYVIPEGDYICVSPALAQLDDQVWGEDAKNFNPYRFEDDNPTLPEAIGHGAFSSYLPFGAGRHRCIGEAFAYVQLKTIIATFVQMFDFEWPQGVSFPKTDFTTLVVMPIKPVSVEYTRRDSATPSKGLHPDLETRDTSVAREE